MEKKNEVLLVIAVILVALSVLANYRANDLELIRQDSINYATFALNFYELSKDCNDTHYQCTWSNMSFPEFQRTELKQYQDQADLIRGKVSFWNLISKIFIIGSLFINIFVIYLEGTKKRA